MPASVRSPSPLQSLLEGNCSITVTVSDVEPWYRLLCLRSTEAQAPPPQKLPAPGQLASLVQAPPPMWQVAVASEQVAVSGTRLYSRHSTTMSSTARPNPEIGSGSPGRFFSKLRKPMPAWNLLPV